MYICTKRKRHKQQMYVDTGFQGVINVVKQGESRRGRGNLMAVQIQRFSIANIMDEDYQRG